MNKLCVPGRMVSKRSSELSHAKRHANCVMEESQLITAHGCIGEQSDAQYQEYSIFRKLMFIQRGNRLEWINLLSNGGAFLRSLERDRAVSCHHIY